VNQFWPGQSQSEVARSFGVCQGWISRLMARYRLEGEAAFELRSRRPKTCSQATPPPVVDLVVRLRKELTGQGGPPVRLERTLSGF